MKSECCTDITENICETSTKIEVRLRTFDQTCEELEKEENDKINNKPSDVVDLKVNNDDFSIGLDLRTTSEEYETISETCKELEKEKINKLIEVIDLRQEIEEYETQPQTCKDLENQKMKKPSDVTDEGLDNDLPFGFDLRTASEEYEYYT